MDIFTHAAVGAATGGLLGYPITGAVAGVAPDLVLGIKRRALPTLAYNSTHSVFGMLVASTAILAYSGFDAAWAGLLAYLSHLFLDYMTHGPVWGPTLLYPHHGRFTAGLGEWEFFDHTWRMGLYCSFLWCATLWVIIK